MTNKLFYQKMISVIIQVKKNKTNKQINKLSKLLTNKILNLIIKEKLKDQINSGKNSKL